MIDTTILLSFFMPPLVCANLMWWEALFHLLTALASLAFGLEAFGSAASDLAASGFAASFLITGFVVLLSASWLVPWVCRSWLRATSGFSMVGSAAADDATINQLQELINKKHFNYYLVNQFRVFKIKIELV